MGTFYGKARKYEGKQGNEDFYIKKFYIKHLHKKMYDIISI